MRTSWNVINKSFLMSKTKQCCKNQNKKNGTDNHSFTAPPPGRHGHHSLGVRQHPEVAANILLSLDQIILGAAVWIEATEWALVVSRRKCRSNILLRVFNQNLQTHTYRHQLTRSIESLVLLLKQSSYVWMLHTLWKGNLSGLQKKLIFIR